MPKGFKYALFDFGGSAQSIKLYVIFVLDLSRKYKIE